MTRPSTHQKTAEFAVFEYVDNVVVFCKYVVYNVIQYFKYVSTISILSNFTKVGMFLSAAVFKKDGRHESCPRRPRRPRNIGIMSPFDTEYYQKGTYLTVREYLARS